MHKRHILRALIVILACSVLLVGALACGSGDGDEEDDLARIEGIATKNLVELEVIQARLEQMEEAEANNALSDRIAALEAENQQLTHRIAVLEGITSMAGAGMTGAAMTEAAPSGLGAAYDAASEEDRKLVRDFLECTMKAAGTDDATIAAMIPESEKMTWQDIEDGGMSIEQLQILRNVVCR
ncbi:MAG: hypothetical protein F4W95_03510 [Chloroflexi bacterium]|nr:hypothetical protein [Chloroflexota bacterium]MYD47537.1 hypothetical protein [Chloroflexota bacterium]